MVNLLIALFMIIACGLVLGALAMWIMDDNEDD